MGMIDALVGGIGGAANAAYDVADTQAKLEARKNELNYSNDLAIKREQAIEQLKAEMAERAAQRDARTKIAADDLGAKNLEEAQFQKFKKDLGQSDASDEELRKVFSDQYFDRSVAPGDANSQRYDPRDSDFIRAGRDAALKTGASSGLLKQYDTELKDQRTVERNAEQDALKLQFEDRKDARQQAQLAQQAEIADKRLAAMVARIGGGSKNDGVKEVLSYIDNSRKELADNEKNIRQAMKQEMDGTASPKKKEEIRSSYQAQLDKITAKRDSLEADFSAVRERVGLPSRSEKPAPKKPDNTDTKDKVAALPMPKSAKEAVAGKVYNTSRGPAKWNGTAFEPI